jgi:hypothetical protein
MAKIVISHETRARLLTAAASGQRIDPWMFQFTRCDQEFQAELVRTAETAKNALFFQGLQEFIAEQEREYWRLYGLAVEQQARKDPAQLKAGQENSGLQSLGTGRHPERKRQKRSDRRKQQGGQPIAMPLRIKRSPNYNPTGMSFAEFLKQKGIHFSPTYKPPFVHFVPGGAVNSNRRKH